MFKFERLVCVYCIVEKKSSGILICRTFDSVNGSRSVGNLRSIGHLVCYKTGWGKSLLEAGRVAAQAVAKECAERGIKVTDIDGLADLLQKETKEATAETT